MTTIEFPTKKKRLPWGPRRRAARPLPPAGWKPRAPSTPAGLRPLAKDLPVSPSDAPIILWFESEALRRDVEAVASMLEISVHRLPPIPKLNNSAEGESLWAPKLARESMVLTDQRELPSMFDGFAKLTVGLEANGTQHGSWVDIWLPKEQRELMVALDAWRGADRHTCTYLVAWWWPVGAPHVLAKDLALALGATLVDASGARSPWQPPEGAITWEALDQEDLGAPSALGRFLPQWEGTPTLSSNGIEPARATDAVVPHLVSALPGKLVVDCGGDVDGLVRVGSSLMALGHPVRSVLVGDASPAAARVLARNMATLGSAAPLQGAHILVGGKPGPLLWSALSSYPVRVSRVPKNRRGWERVARQLEASEGSEETDELGPLPQQPVSMFASTVPGR